MWSSILLSCCGFGLDQLAFCLPGASMVCNLGREYLVKILASGLVRKLLSLVWHVLSRYKRPRVTNETKWNQTKLSQTNLTDKSICKGLSVTAIGDLKMWEIFRVSGYSAEYLEFRLFKADEVMSGDKEMSGRWSNVLKCWSYCWNIFGESHPRCFSYKHNLKDHMVECQEVLGMVFSETVSIIDK